jgi:hypothetical protein
VQSVEISASTLRIAVSEDPEAGHRLLAIVATRRLPIVAVERARPTLEDVFLRLTGRAAHGEAA